MDRDSQNNRVLSFFMDGGRLTPGEARDKFGIDRLAARVHDLKAKGWRIKRTMVTRKNRDFRNVRVAQYWLSNENPNQGEMF